MSAIRRILAIFPNVLRVESGGGKKERVLEKLKRVSRCAPLVGGGRALRDAGPILIMSQSRSNVNKPGGVKLRRRVGKDREGREESSL